MYQHFSVTILVESTENEELISRKLKKTAPKTNLSEPLNCTKVYDNIAIKSILSFQIFYSKSWTTDNMLKGVACFFIWKLSYPLRVIAIKKNRCVLAQFLANFFFGKKRSNLTLGCWKVSNLTYLTFWGFQGSNLT